MRIVDAERAQRRAAHKARRRALAHGHRLAGRKCHILLIDDVRPKSICINCGDYGPHFVPPSMGEEGFFTCQAA